MDVTSFSPPALPSTQHLVQTLDILADLGATPAYIGAMLGEGGTFAIDSMVGVQSEVREYTLITPSDLALQIVSADIGWDDGVDWGDYGWFQITPGAPLDLIDKVAGPAGVNTNVVWTQTLSEETSRQKWLSIVGIEAEEKTSSSSGHNNQVCLEGQYYEDMNSVDDDAKICVTIWGVKQPLAKVLSSLPPALQGSYELVAAHGGSLLLPGSPSLYL
jgi:hypothetical protein